MPQIFAELDAIKQLGILTHKAFTHWQAFIAQHDAANEIPDLNNRTVYREDAVVLICVDHQNIPLEFTVRMCADVLGQTHLCRLTQGQKSGR